jgi:hypothetical protein
MKKLKSLVAATAVALIFLLDGKALAQPQGGPPPGMNFQNMDPQQMMDMIQERINSSLRERMAITNDAEWAIIEQRINAVTKARMATMADSGLMGGMMPGGRAGGFASMFGTPSPEAEALRRAVEDNAPPAQIHALLLKFQAARKEKEAAAAKAQAELKTVLTVRQEAIAVVSGLIE